MSSLPLVSVIFLAYNQKDYVRDAVRGCLKQDYKNIQYIFSDDCSTDNTFEIIGQEVSSIDGDIILNRNKINLGLTRHFNHVLSMARGELIVMAAGDDISLPDRVSNTVKYLMRYPGASFISFNDFVINDVGSITGRYNAIKALTEVSLKQFLNEDNLGFSGASRGFHRKVFETFGELAGDCPTEDTPYLLRSLYLGNGLLAPEPAIHYRIHGNNLSARDSLRRMKHQKIYKQYMVDLACAVSRGVISSAESEKVGFWVGYNQKRRQLVLMESPLIKVLGYVKMFFEYSVFRKKVFKRFFSK